MFVIKKIKIMEVSLEECLEALKRLKCLYGNNLKKKLDLEIKQLGKKKNEEQVKAGDREFFEYDGGIAIVEDKQMTVFYTCQNNNLLAIYSGEYDLHIEQQEWFKKKYERGGNGKLFVHFHEEVEKGGWSRDVLVKLDCPEASLTDKSKYYEKKKKYNDFFVKNDIKPPFEVMISEKCGVVSPMAGGSSGVVCPQSLGGNGILSDFNKQCGGKEIPNTGFVPVGSYNGGNIMVGVRSPIESTPGYSSPLIDYSYSTNPCCLKCSTSDGRQTGDYGLKGVSVEFPNGNLRNSNGNQMAETEGFCNKVIRVFSCCC